MSISKLSVFIIFLTLFFQVFNSAAIAQDTADTELLNGQNDLDTAANETHLAIVGGYRPVKHTLAKYLVSLRTTLRRRFFGDDHYCGGCIIGPRIILTAAHCLLKDKSDQSVSARDVSVVAKSTNRLVETKDTEKISAEVIRIHPGYNIKNFANDVAIVKLKKDIVLDDNLAAIIPLANNPPKAGTQCTAVGWGRILPNGPLSANVLYIDVEIWDKIFCSYYSNFRMGMLCVANWYDYQLDVCTGDSGGPLICDLKLVGLVSFGRGCASGIPGVYTDVWFYRNWIEENDCNCRVGSRYLILFVVFILIIFY